MRYSVFIGAAVLTVIVISVGVQIGVMLENSRVQEVRQFIEDTEMLFSDARLQSLYYDTMNLSDEQCNAALQSNLEFNEIIYNEGLRLERYEGSNRFADLLPERKRYALLQMQFWLNAEKIREKCNFNYSTVIYFFKINATEQNVQIDQKLTSAILLEVKEQCGADMMLSPIPANAGLSAINAITRSHNVTITPSVLINNRELISGVPSKAELIKKFGC